MNLFTQSPLSLKVKLPLSIVVIVVITFSFSTFFSFRNFTSVVQSVKNHHLEVTAQNIGENISTRILQAGRDMVMTASFPNVLQAVDMPPASQKSPQHEVLRANLTNLFSRFLLTYGHYNRFYILNNAGEFILGTKPLVKNFTEGKAKLHFQEAKKAGGFHVSETVYNTANDRIIVPIFLEIVYNGYRGFLVSSLHISKIANAAMQSVAHENISPYILALQGSTILDIAHEGKVTLQSGAWIEELKKNSSGVLNIDIDGEEYSLGYYHVPQTDIYAVTLAEASFMSIPQDNLRHTTVLINLIGVIIITLFLLYMTTPIAHEIAHLSLFAQAITKGQENVHISTQRQDELGTLAISLEKMVNKLKDMVTRSEEATKAKSDFLACMSHEIRTPMNGILGMTHLALQANPEAKQKEFLLRIDTAANTLLGVINDILDFSKIEADKLSIQNETFRLSGVLSSMRDILESKATTKGLDLNFLVDKDVPDVIYSDPLRFAQICINLCSNSIKFTALGEVTLRISLVEKFDDDIILKIAVKDTGIGIAPEDQVKIFDSFSQADGTSTRKYGGTGLGLAISKSLTHLLGGEIWVESTPNVGSTFTFTMQAKQGLENNLEEAESIPQSKLTLKPLNILLVEDNEINQEIALEVLKNMGMHVTLANNGAEGVSLFEKYDFDLIFMDIQMPVMDGITATKTIRKSNHPHAQSIPIIAMTAHAMTGDKEISLGAGMNDHITKPINIDELYQTLYTWGKA